MDISGNEVNLAEFENQVLLIVNTASKGNAKDELHSLQKLYEAYHDDGFTVLAFPCRQFLKQESKKTDKIRKIYFEKEKVTFPVMELTKVNGEKANPLFIWLKLKDPGLLGEEIDWNYTKFLVYPDGATVQRISPTVSYLSISSSVEKALYSRVTEEGEVIQNEHHDDENDPNENYPNDNDPNENDPNENDPNENDPKENNSNENHVENGNEDINQLENEVNN